MIAALGFLSILSGCGVYNSQFECKAANGMKCQSLSEINKAVNEEERMGSFKEGIQTSDAAQNPPKEPYQLVPFPDHQGGYLINTEPQVIRMPEETMRVWIAPYKNKSDEYVDESHIHIVTKEGRWINR